MVLKTWHTLGIISIIVLTSTLSFPDKGARAIPIITVESPQSVFLAIRQIAFFETNDFRTELLVKFYVGGFFQTNKTLCGIQPTMSVYINVAYYAPIQFRNVTGNSQGACDWVGNENATAFYVPSFGSLFTPFNVYEFNVTLFGDQKVAYRADCSVYLALDYPTSHNYVITSTFRNSTTSTGQTVFSYLITFRFPTEQKIGWTVNVVVYIGAFIGGVAAILSLLKRLMKRRRRVDVAGFLGVGYEWTGDR